MTSQTVSFHTQAFITSQYAARFQQFYSDISQHSYQKEQRMGRIDEDPGIGLSSAVPRPAIADHPFGFLPRGKSCYTHHVGAGCQLPDPKEDFSEESLRHSHLRHLEDHMPRTPDRLGTNFDRLLT
jgi:hypothetical protein